MTVNHPGAVVSEHSLTRHVTRREFWERVTGGIGYVLIAILALIGGRTLQQVDTIVSQHTAEVTDTATAVRALDQYAYLLAYDVNLICAQDHLACIPLPAPPPGPQSKTPGG